MRTSRIIGHNVMTSVPASNAEPPNDWITASAAALAASDASSLAMLA